MILSDRSIKQEIKDGRIIIDPYDESCVQPASLDVHLDATFIVFQPWEYPHYIDLRQSLDKLSSTVIIGKEQFFSLQPGQFVLASTIENIELPNDLMARLEGKSSLGRVGLLIHATAGYVDPGWKGTLTLELYNVSPMPIHLYPEMKISQISFHKLTTSVDTPYGDPKLGSKYFGQRGPVATKYFQDFKQPNLISFSESKIDKTSNKKINTNQTFKRWLDQSRFKGQIGKFSEEVGIPNKTIQNWLYRDINPSKKYERILYRFMQRERILEGAVSYPFDLN